MDLLNDEANVRPPWADELARAKTGDAVAAALAASSISLDIDSASGGANEPEEIGVPRRCGLRPFDVQEDVGFRLPVPGSRRKRSRQVHTLPAVSAGKNRSSAGRGGRHRSKMWRRAAWMGFNLTANGKCRRMDTSAMLAELHAASPLIGPSLLACDFAHLAREVAAVEAAGAHLLHLDIMDGHFVPNLSFGLPIVEAVRRVTELPLDVHLMISEPDRYVEQFRKAGADMITFHAEAVAEPVPLLRRIRGLGALAGISINPPTPVSVLEGCSGECDLVLVMSVMPGFGGQEFQADVLDKFRWLRRRFGPDVLLSVDGGVNGETIAPCAAAGANLFVVGTGLFRYPDYGKRLTELRDVAKSAREERT